MLTILPLRTQDRSAWEILARGYKTFYETVLSDAEYEKTWQRLMAGQDVHGLGAHLERRAAGACEGRCQLAADVAGLADAEHDDAAAAGEQALAGGDEGRIDALDQVLDRLRFDAQRGASEVAKPVG